MVERLLLCRRSNGDRIRHGTITAACRFLSITAREEACRSVSSACATRHRDVMPNPFRFGGLASDRGLEQKRAGVTG